MTTPEENLAYWTERLTAAQDDVAVATAELASAERQLSDVQECYFSAKTWAEARRHDAWCEATVGTYCGCAERVPPSMPSTPTPPTGEQ